MKSIPTILQILFTTIYPKAKKIFWQKWETNPVLPHRNKTLASLNNFKEFNRVPKGNMTVSRALIPQGKALNMALGTKLRNQKEQTII